MYGLKVISKLAQRKYRQEYGCFVVEGKRGVEDAVAAGARITDILLSRSFQRQNGDFSNTTLKSFFANRLVTTVDDESFAKLSDTASPQGVAAVVEMPRHTVPEISVSSLVAVLEDVRDPGNLGTMIRTADWFGVGGMVLLGGADPYQPKVVRSTMGSLFHMPIVQIDAVSQVEALKSQGFSIVVTRPEVDVQGLSNSLPTQKTALVFGNEAHGTSAEMDKLADASFTIPRLGKAESLNVAVSFGIVLYQLRLQ